jgi:hypothetical protein
MQSERPGLLPKFLIYGSVLLPVPWIVISVYMVVLAIDPFWIASIGPLHLVLGCLLLISSLVTIIALAVSVFRRHRRQDFTTASSRLSTSFTILDVLLVLTVFHFTSLAKQFEVEFWMWGYIGARNGTAVVDDFLREHQEPSLVQDFVRERMIKLHDGCYIASFVWLGLEVALVILPRLVSPESLKLVVAPPPDAIFVEEAVETADVVTDPTIPDDPGPFLGSWRTPAEPKELDPPPPHPKSDAGPIPPRQDVSPPPPDHRPPRKSSELADPSDGDGKDDRNGEFASDSPGDTKDRAKEQPREIVFAPGSWSSESQEFADSDSDHNAKAEPSPFQTLDESDHHDRDDQFASPSGSEARKPPRKAISLQESEFGPPKRGKAPDDQKPPAHDAAAAQRSKKPAPDQAEGKPPPPRKPDEERAPSRAGSEKPSPKRPGRPRLDSWDQPPTPTDSWDSSPKKSARRIPEPPGDSWDSPLPKPRRTAAPSAEDSWVRPAKTTAPTANDSWDSPPAKPVRRAAAPASDSWDAPRGNPKPRAGAAAEDSWDRPAKRTSQAEKPPAKGKAEAKPVDFGGFRFDSPIRPPKGRRREAAEGDDLFADDTFNGAPPPSPRPQGSGPNKVSFESPFSELDEQGPPRKKAAGGQAANPFGAPAPAKPVAARPASKPASRVPKVPAKLTSDDRMSDGIDLSFEDGVFVTPEIEKPKSGRGAISPHQSIETDIGSLLGLG